MAQPSDPRRATAGGFAWRGALGGLGGRDEGGDAGDDLGALQQRRVALVGYLQHIKAGAARPHGFDGRRRQNVRIAAADDHDRHPGKGVELVPQVRERPLEIGRRERLHQPHVVIGNDASARRLERPACEGDPVVTAQLRKLAGEQGAQDVACVLEACRLRQLADIALDPHHALGLDHRADVVEHAGGDRGRAGHGKEHGQDAPARRPYERRLADVECGEHCQNVGEFDRQAVIGRIGIVVRAAATTRIERDHASRRIRIVRQRGRQCLEVGRGAREPRQAHHRQRRRDPRPKGARKRGHMAAHVQLEPVLGGDEDAGGGIGNHSKYVLSDIGASRRRRPRAI